MSINKGCISILKLGTDTVAKLTSITNSVTGEQLEVTTFDSSCTKEFINGLVSGQISIQGFYDKDDTTGQRAMMTALLNGTTLTTTQKPSFLPDGVNGITADANVADFEIGSEVAGVVTFSANLQLTGLIELV